MGKRISKDAPDLDAGIVLKDFKLVHFAVTALQKHDDIAFSIQTEIAKSASGDTMRVQFDIAGYMVDDDQPGSDPMPDSRPIVEISTQTYFELIVEGEEDLSNFDVPSHITTTMLTVAYGTTRGVLLSNTAKTALEGLLLPISKVSALVTEVELRDNGHERGM